ncbi:MAG: maleylpyruvate isomerase family mycothiol-dependent enzyme [Pseudonocardia sp.]|nr:maleylpyruvate isomerase family mycothiol-dependent enzyme [Pseudonocardia sp.]
MSRTLTETLAWAGDGAAHLRGLMTRMGDEAFGKPSALPGWTRAHVLTHVARNADALMNLLHWARTGEVTPMYSSPEQRNADIESGASRAPAVIREDVVRTSDRLAAAVKAMPKNAWTVVVRNGQGMEIPVGEVGWLRAREMWIHSVDLDVGASFEDFPPPMLRELLDDVTRTLSLRDDAPAVRLVATDRDDVWSVGEEAGAVSVSGPTADLAAWVSGRNRSRALRTDDGSKVPALPAWL